MSKRNRKPLAGGLTNQSEGPPARFPHVTQRETFMPKALSQNLETIAALPSFCVFGYQTEDLLPAVAEAGYFVGCASRLMANELILVCAARARNPAWGLSLVSRGGTGGGIHETGTGFPAYPTHA